MQIEGDGFLKHPLPKLAEMVPGADQARADILFEVCKYTKSLIAEFDLGSPKSSRECQKIIAVVCLVRMLEVAQSILILAAYGVREELYSLLRVFLEAYFVLANCCRDEEFVKKFLQRDALARLKLVNTAAKYDTELFRKVNEHATAEVKAKLQALKDSENIQASTAEQYAANVGCQQIYDSIYRITSASIHTTARCIEHYIKVDAQGNIAGILHCSDAEITNLVLHETATRMILALQGICECCEVDKSSEIDQFNARLVALEDLFANN